MKSVKLFLYIVLLAIDTTSSAADDFTGLVSGEGYSEDFGSAEPFLSCTINQPTVDYCISIYDGKPVLRALSQVTSNLSTPLIFSLSYEDEIPSFEMKEVPPVIMNATCSDQNCTALFIIEPVYELYDNLTVNVTVSTDNCSNSTVKITSGPIWTNAVVDVKVGKITETGATIVCELLCFSKDFGCLLTYITWLNKSVTIQDPTFHISNITGDPYSYSYPSQNITVTDLASDNMYHYCVHAINLTTMNISGFPLCGNFTTVTKLHHNESEGISGALIAVITTVPVLAVLMIIVAIMYYYCYKKNRALDGQTTAAQLARAVAGRSGFFVQLASGQADEPEIRNGSDTEQKHEIDDFSHVAPSDDISLPSAEYTDSV